LAHDSRPVLRRIIGRSSTCSRCSRCSSSCDFTSKPAARGRLPPGRRLAAPISRGGPIMDRPGTDCEGLQDPCPDEFLHPRKFLLRRLPILITLPFIFTVDKIRNHIQGGTYAFSNV